MRSTQTYTPTFGSRIATLHKKHAECLGSFLAGSAARRVTCSTCPSAELLETTMGEWPDACLDRLGAFVTRRLAKARLLCNNRPLAVRSTPVVVNTAARVARRAHHNWRSLARRMPLCKWTR